MAEQEKSFTGLQKALTELYQNKWNNPNLTFSELIRTLYVDKKLSMAKVANELNISPHTVNRWLKDEGIASRKMQWM